MRFLRYIFCALLFVTAAVADTINIDWMDGNTTYAQTTCEIGGDIILPTTPTKRGYTFKGWVARYTRLEYIESTGTQYIDTGFTPDSNTRVVCKYKYTGTNTPMNLFGARQSTTSRAFTYGVSTTGDRRVGWNNATTSYIAEDTNWHIVDFDGKNKKVKVDNQTLTTLSEVSFTTPVTMCLFATHAAGGSGIYNGENEIAYCQIWDNDVLVGDFIPAKRTSDNVIGMYDLVSQTFFTNAGTGEFIAGPVAGNQSFSE